jgi:hypothetical protein
MFEILLLIVILILVIIIYTRVQTENFDNCFGMQYYGGGMEEDPKKPVCAQGSTKPLYREGGCAVYDPDKISRNYEEGKYEPGV